MRKEYGVSINEPNEAVFCSGLFSCVEYCRVRLNSFEEVEQDIPKLKELSEKYHVKVRSFHLPFTHDTDYSFIPSSVNAEERAKTLEHTKKLITEMKELGIEYVVIHGSLGVEPEERPERLKCFVEYLQQLCDFCKPLGVSVAVETLKPRCIGNGSEELLYIMEHANRDNLGICFDSNHLLEEDNMHFLQKAGQYILTTHLSDFDGIDERHWFPGRGINDWKKITALMEEKGYTGPWVFEVTFSEAGPTDEELHTLIAEWEKMFQE